MEPHCLIRIFFSLSLMLMTTHAALPPEIYWKMMLPSTPMPKAIVELLRGDVSMRKSADTYNQSKDELSKLGAKKILSEDNLFWLHAGKATQSKDQLLISSLGVKEIPSEDNLFWLHAGKATQSKDQLLISDIGAKEIPSEDNLFWLHAGKVTQSKDQLLISDLGAKEIPSEDNSFWLHADKATRPKDQVLISNLGTKEIPSEDNLFWLHAGKATRSKDQVPISNLGTEEIPSEDNLFWLHAGKETRSKDQLLISDLGTKEIPSQDSLWISASEEAQSKDEIFISNLDAKEIIPSQENSFWISYSKETQLPSNANGLENPGSSNHHLHEVSSRASFFLEDQLHSSNKFYMLLNKIRSAAPLLPRQITQQIPFSLDKMKEILEMLSIKPNSRNAEIVEETIGICEAPAMDGEEKYCATSLESMIDFATSKLGNNVHAMSTNVQKETKLQNLLVKDGVKNLADGHVIACHPMTYPYVVFGCHELHKTSAYYVPLEGEDGVRVKAVAVCHKDTSKWDPNHVAFQVLKVKPGTVPVCHFFTEGHVLWLSK
ncbi:uncharacterized protein LOC130727496 [Lotus japonicus]|uniref:uncharacterized protein LOC130727496 n=1 Tax=Lotus japonicus TaxID=34305 RepID=UPI00258C982F|nr:uncharacterized protein LOC130727496 [Lotus japonicus]